MTILDACEFIKKYAECPICGSAPEGGGNGTIECDIEKGYFKRTCLCGWGIEIKENNNGH